MLVIKISNKFKYISILIIIICILITIILKYNTNKIKEVSANIGEKIEKENVEKSKIAYLTFDDGPSKYETEKILDILKEEKVKATFFVLGKNVKQYPQIVKREYEEGHYIANHGYSHNNNKLYKNEESFIKEIEDTEEEISKAIGIKNYCSHIFRFPNGYMSKIYKKEKERALKILEKKNYNYIDWNCLNRDSQMKLSKYQLLENLKKTSKNKNTLIILMHDTADVNKTSEVLKDSIQYLRNNGYEFKNLYDNL